MWGRKGQKAWVFGLIEAQEDKGEKKDLKSWRTRDVWALYFSFFSKLDRLSTDQVPIEPGKRFSSKNFKIFDQSKIGFDQLKNKFDWSSTNQGSIELGRDKA